MCQFVNKLEDDRESLDFSPVKVGSELIDDNPDNYNLNEMREVIHEAVYLNLSKFFMENKDSLFIEHCRWKVIYQLKIGFTDFCSKYFFDFSEDDIKLNQAVILYLVFLPALQFKFLQSFEKN